jgi:hypothetical protein
MRTGSTILAAIGLFFLTAGFAMAQESFTDLQSTLRPGDTVDLTDASGAKTRGSVTGVQPSTLRLAVAGIEREWAASEVREVRRRGDSVKNGAIIGAVAGGVVGGIGGWALGSLFVNEGASFAGPFLTVLALGAGGGAGIGAGVDALIPGRTLVYRQTNRALTVSPLVSRDARGVHVAFRF